MDISYWMFYPYEPAKGYSIINAMQKLDEKIAQEETHDVSRS